MNPNGKNRRDVWSLPNVKSKTSHAAIMPENLAEICVLGGSEPGDVVLDPFCGTGSTGAAALKTGRSFVGVDLVPDYAAQASERLTKLLPESPQAGARPQDPIPKM